MAHKTLADSAAVNRTLVSGVDPDVNADALLGGAALLGLLQHNAEDWFKRGGNQAIDGAAVDVLIEERRAARAARDFKRADEIRDELAALNIAIEDGAQGTRWSVLKN